MLPWRVERRGVVEASAQYLSCASTYLLAEDPLSERPVLSAFPGPATPEEEAKTVQIRASVFGPRVHRPFPTTGERELRHGGVEVMLVVMSGQLSALFRLRRRRTGCHHRGGQPEPALRGGRRARVRDPPHFRQPDAGHDSHRPRPRRMSASPPPRRPLPPRSIGKIRHISVLFRSLRTCARVHQGP